MEILALHWTSGADPGFISEADAKKLKKGGRTVRILKGVLTPALNPFGSATGLGAILVLNLDSL